MARSIVRADSKGRRSRNARSIITRRTVIIIIIDTNRWLLLLLLTDTNASRGTTWRKLAVRVVGRESRIIIFADNERDSRFEFGMVD